MRDTRGITLIALVITIIVLLILAGVAIVLTVGNNGLFTRADSASKEYSKAEIKEELELLIGDLQVDLLSSNKSFISVETEKALTGIGAIVIDKTEEIILGEYKDYEFTIDKDGNITIGRMLTGVKPTAEIIVTPTTMGVDKVTIQVIASTTEGEIANIESLDGLIAIKEEGNNNKTYEVEDNKEYKFKITGDNGRIAIVKQPVNNILVESESLLEGISKINSSGTTKVKVTGEVDNGSSSTEEYTLNVIYYNGNLSIGNTLKSGEDEITITNLVSTDGNTWTCGNTNDIGKNTVVLKVDGNLTIETGKILTTLSASNDAPKGLVVYCTGDFSNNGKISMDVKGSKATGQNVYLHKKQDDSYIYVPSVGGAGGAWKYRVAGESGKTPSTLLGTGGGGGGSHGQNHAGDKAGKAGSSYGGGIGGVSTPSFNNNAKQGGGMLVVRASNIIAFGNYTAKGTSGTVSKNSTANQGTGGSSGCGTIAIFANKIESPLTAVGLLGNYRNGFTSYSDQLYGGYGGNGKGIFVSLEDEQITTLESN